MTNELIRFPEVGKGWRDTGEGGMYVYAVVPKPVEFKDNCVIENTIALTAPDYPVSDIRDFWGDPTSAAEDESARDDAARLLDREGFAAKAAMVRGLISLDRLSLDMLAAIYMGSTNRSLMATDDTDGYWEATWEDLTPTGTLLMDRLHVSFGVTPTLLTFLDT